MFKCGSAFFKLLRRRATDLPAEKKEKWVRAYRPIHYGKTCAECGKYSKTKYCTINRKVLAPDKEACRKFAFRKRLGVQHPFRYAPPHKD